MTTIGQLLGAARETSEKGMEEVFQFEKKLASIYEKNSHEADHMKMTVADLLSLCPAVGFFINIMKLTLKPFDWFLKSITKTLLELEKSMKMCITKFLIFFIKTPCT